MSSWDLQKIEVEAAEIVEPADAAEEHSQAAALRELGWTVTGCVVFVLAVNLLLGFMHGS